MADNILNLTDGISLADEAAEVAGSKNVGDSGEVADRISGSASSYAAAERGIFFDRQRLEAALDLTETPDKSFIADQKQITAYASAKDSAGMVSDWIPYREFRVTDSFAQASARSVVKDVEISNAVDSYFPDYFHQQTPYQDLIEALAIQTSFGYSMASIIKLVYDIDNASDNRRTYNALLRLLGITHDFGDAYPSRMLKFLIQNYLSIRKHRGTKNSILAMLRAMDPEYLADPDHPNNAEFEFIEYSAKQGITIDRAGVLQITYEHYPAEYDEHIRYMLNKVVPTGIAYRLVTKKVSVRDQFIIFDRAMADLTSIVFRLSERAEWSESLSSQALLSQREYLALKDIRNSEKQDTSYFEEFAYIEIHVADSLQFEEGTVTAHLSVTDSMDAESRRPQLTELEYVVKRVTDAMAQAADSNSQPAIASDWPYPQYNKIDSLSPESISIGDTAPQVARLIKTAERLLLADRISEPLKVNRLVSENIELDDQRYRVTIYEN